MTDPFPPTCAHFIIDVYVSLQIAEEQVTEVRRLTEIKEDEERGAGKDEETVERAVREVVRQHKVNFDEARKQIERAVDTLVAVKNMECVKNINVLETAKTQAERALRSITDNPPINDIIHTLKLARAEYRAHL